LERRVKKAKTQPRRRGKLATDMLGQLLSSRQLRRILAVEVRRLDLLEEGN
jgi:hypothetical protein